MIINLPKILKGKIVSIVATGESLKGFDFSRLQGYIIAVNDAVRFVNADMFISLDKAFYKNNKQLLDSFKGLIITDRDVGRSDILKITYEESNYDWYLQKCNMSGFTAIAVAFYLGAKIVYLFGFDCGWKEKPYFFDSIEKEQEPYRRQIEYFEIFRNYPVINVTDNSYLDVFQKRSLREKEIYRDMETFELSEQRIE